MKFKFYKNFSLKNHYREKKTKCNVVPQVEKFYRNLISQQKSKFISLLESHNNYNIEFLLRATNINNLIYNDTNIATLISKKLEQNKNNIGSKTSLYYLLQALSEKHTSDPDTASAKDLVREIVKKSYLFNDDELYELLRSFGLKDKEIEELRENIEQEEYQYINKLSFKQDKFHIKMSSKKDKFVISSKKLNKKIVIIGLDDNVTENVMKCYDYVDKEKPNIMLFQKKPVFNLNGSGKYVSHMDKDMIMAYYREVLSSDKYYINNVEKLVEYFNIGL
jgi:hypothetical protein